MAYEEFIRDSVEQRPTGFHLKREAWEKAVRENRVAALDETGNEVDGEGNKESDIKYVVFVRGTLGYRVADAFRVTPNGRIYDGFFPVPVAVSNVSPEDPEDLLRLDI